MGKMILVEEEIVKQALKEVIALKNSESDEWDAVERVIPKMCDIASKALKAIEAAEKQEPVARYFEQWGNSPLQEIDEQRYATLPEDVRFKLYTAPPATMKAVPEGWKLVPVEPTKEWGDNLDESFAFATIRKVLAAAPEHPAEPSTGSASTKGPSI